MILLRTLLLKSNDLLIGSYAPEIQENMRALLEPAYLTGMSRQQDKCRYHEAADRLINFKTGRFFYVYALNKCITGTTQL